MSAVSSVIVNKLPFGFNDLPTALKGEAIKFLPNQLLQFATVSKETKKAAEDKSVWKEAAKSLNIDLRLESFPNSDPKETLINEVHRINKALKASTFLPDREEILKIKDSLARLEAYRSSIKKNGKEMCSMFGGPSIVYQLTKKEYSQWNVNELYSILDYFLESGFSDSEQDWKASFENIVKMLDYFEYQQFPTYKAVLALKKMMKVFMANEKIPPAKKYEIMQKLIDSLLPWVQNTNDELMAIHCALEAWARPSEAAIKNAIDKAVREVNRGTPFKSLLKLQMVFRYLSEEKRNSLIEWLDTLPAQGNEKSFPMIRKLLQNESLLTIFKDLNLLSEIERTVSASNWMEKMSLDSTIFSSVLYLLVKNNPSEESKKILMEIVRKAEQGAEADLKSPQGNTMYSDLHHYAKVKALIGGESLEKVRKVKADIKK